MYILKHFETKFKVCRPPRWLSAKAFASHAGDQGSIPGQHRPKSLKQVVTGPLGNR